MKARPVDGIDPAAPLRPNAALIVRTRLGELQALAGTALEPGAASVQHDMRIAAKRLRYALEVVAGCFGPEAVQARDAAKALQGVLGEIHDCDTMLPRAAGIESLEMLLRTRRELSFNRFRELWQAQARSGVWTVLEETCRDLNPRVDP
jgi:CHAD domain-containing protein